MKELKAYLHWFCNKFNYSFNEKVIEVYLKIYSVRYMVSISYFAKFIFAWEIPLF